MPDRGTNDNDPHRAAYQSNDEWLSEYFGEAITTSRRPEVSTTPTKPREFRFLDHRTTTGHSVVMIFESIPDGAEAVAFFNVSLESSRGKKYPARTRGQFIPPRLGKFRRLWMQAVGKQPDRWDRVHKTMRATLRDLVFVGDVETAYNGHGEPFNRLKNVRAK